MTSNPDNRLALDRVVAGQLLMSVARHSSQSMDAFSGWMLAGFRGAFALVLANIDRVATFLKPEALKVGASWYLGAVLLGVVEKALAAVVASGVAAGVDGEAMGRQIAENELQVDFSQVFTEMEKALWPPFRGVARNAFKKSVAGDHAAGGRLCLAFAQVQSWIVAIEAILVVIGALIVLGGL